MNTAFPELLGLKQRVEAGFNHSLEKKHLEWKEYLPQTMLSSGIEFRVVVAGNLEKKEKHGPNDFVKSNINEAEIKSRDPFARTDSELCLGSFGKYNIFLNKFPVIKKHFLIATKEWELQEEYLNYKDFEAIVSIMNEYNDLICIYNCGSKSGASVAHKHIQFIPAEDGMMNSSLPVSRLFQDDKIIKFEDKSKQAFHCKDIPFIHAIARFTDIKSIKSKEQAKKVAQECYDKYTYILNTTTSLIDPKYLSDQDSFENPSQSKSKLWSHSFLIVSDWMLVVPRRARTAKGIGFNTLSFSGQILANNENVLNVIMSEGPLNLLCEVSYPK